MFRTSICLTAAALLVGSVLTSSAQTAAPAEAPKASKTAVTKAHMKEMRAKWRANKPKMKACRKEAKGKGLTEDDRWFFIEDCMNKN